MAVPEQTPYKEYTANGVTKIFPLEFDVLEKDHLIVLVNDSEPSVGSWSLDAVNDTVVFVKAPANGVNVKIRRDTPLERSTDYKTYNASFNPPSVNADFDNIWRKLQEMGVLNWLSNNNIKDLNEYVDSLNGETKEQFLAMIEKQGVSLNQLDDYYNYILGKLATISSDKDWDASFIAYNEKFTQQKINNGFESVAEMLAIINPKNGTRVYLKSYYKSTNFALSTPYKGGNRHFTFDSTKALINNRGTIINGWVSEEIIEHTPEMWGAYGDNDHDDADAINNMFRTLQPYPVGINCKFSEIRGLLDYCKKYTVRLTSVYKHSKTIYIPCGITLVQPIDGRWNWDIGVGFNYQPVTADYDTAAVATIAYAFNNDAATIQDGTFKFVSDIYYKPTATLFDTGEYVTLGWHVDLQGLSIKTNANVTLGLFLNGFFGKTTGVSVGVASHPKVGIVTNLGWNVQHDYTFVTASQQGVVFHGVCNQNTMIAPLVNCRAGAIKTTSVVVPYNDPSILTTGTIAFTNNNSMLKLVSPCYQSWNIGVANINNSIFESEFAYSESLLCKYEYLNVKSNMNVKLTGYFGGYFYDDVINDADDSVVPFRRSAVFIADMGDGSQYSANFSGSAKFGVWRWVDGQTANSGSCVNLDIDNALDAVGWGRLGNTYLVNTLNLHNKYSTIYVDPVGGDDDNFGFSTNRPRKSLTSLGTLINAGATTVIILGSITISNQVIAIPSSVVIEAKVKNKTYNMTLDSGRFSLSDNVKLTLDGFTVSSSATNGTYMMYPKPNSSVKINIYGDVNYNQSVCYASDNCEIDLSITGNYVEIKNYLNVASEKVCLFGLSANYDSAAPSPITEGAVMFKYKYPASL